MKDWQVIYSNLKWHKKEAKMKGFIKICLKSGLNPHKKILFRFLLKKGKVLPNNYKLAILRHPLF